MRISKITMVVLGVVLFINCIRLYFTSFTPANTNERELSNSDRSGFSTSPNRSSNQADVMASNSCRKHNIHFLKLHKTGSTTFFGILNRVALRDNLRVTTYSLRPFFSPSPEALVTNLVPKFVVGQSQKYHIHAHHSRNDKEYLAKILETPYVNITIMRDPVTLLRSWILEAKLNQTLPLKGPDPLRAFLTGIESHKKKRPQDVAETRNTMSTMFRIKRDLDPNSDTFKNYLKDISTDFLVGLTEHYAESLVLIRRRLCWSLRDVMYVPLRITPRRTSLKVQHEGLRDLVCAWSHLDCRLYDHFNRTFWGLIAKEGPGFIDEVTHFQMMLKETFNYCRAVYADLKGATRKVAQFNATKPLLTFPKSHWNEAFSIGVIDCALMRLDEFPLENLFYYIQQPSHCDHVFKDKRTLCRIEGEFLGSNLCKHICEAKNKSGMVVNFLEDPRSYIWH